MPTYYIIHVRQYFLVERRYRAFCEKVGIFLRRSPTFVKLGTMVKYFMKTIYIKNVAMVPSVNMRGLPSL